MSDRTQAEADAYRDGLDAAYRVGKYSNITTPPDCPYSEPSPESEAWWGGFGDGTEDMIASRLSE